MTRAQAIDRVKKLLALARGSSEPNERASAERRASELKAKYHLEDSDIQASGKAAAFDELMSIVGEYSSKHPELQANMFGAAKIVEEVLDHSKKNLAASHKAVLLDKIVSGLSVATFVFGDTNQTLNDVREIVDSLLKTHGLRNT